MSQPHLHHQLPEADLCRGVAVLRFIFEGNGLRLVEHIVAGNGLPAD